MSNQHQNFEVHLTHQSIKTTENKQVKEVVHYQYKNGKQALNDYLAIPLKFTRTITTDQATGGKTYGNWIAAKETTFNKVISPTLKGLTPDASQIAAIDKVTGDTADIDKTVVYRANPEKARVTYLDDTHDKILSSQELTGDFGTRDNYKTDETIKKYQGQGYALVSDTYPKTGIIYDEDGRVKYYEVHLSHHTVKTIETKTVNEVVHYVYQNGDKAVTDFVAIPLEFTRTVTTDQATGDKTDGDWIASSGTSFDKVISPSLKNYTPDEPQVAAIDKVSGETKDIVKTIVYTKVPRPVKMPPDKDKVVPHYPSQPSESGHKTQTPSVPVIAQASKKELPDTGAKSGIAETIFGVIIFFATAKWLKLRKNQE